jgi:uncharacterized membrane protein
MAIQDNTTQDHPVIAATRARQGRWGKHVLWVLIVSTALAALVLMATWGFNAPRLSSVQENVRADTPAEVTVGESAQSPVRQK